MSTVNTATTEAVEHAVDAAFQAVKAVSCRGCSDRGARAALKDFAEYLQEFASGSSHDDLIAEIRALHREVTR